MKLVSCNVNGIRAVHNKNLFLPFIHEVKPDFLCLQETKAEKGQAIIDLPDYEEYWNSSTRKKGYAGTAIFVNKKYTVHSVLLGLPEDIAKKFNLEDSFGDANAEGRVLAVELDRKIGPPFVAHQLVPGVQLGPRLTSRMAPETLCSIGSSIGTFLSEVQALTGHG